MFTSMTVVQTPSRNLKQKESEASVRYTVFTLGVDTLESTQSWSPSSFPSLSLLIVNVCLEPDVVVPCVQINSKLRIWHMGNFQTKKYEKISSSSSWSSCHIHIMSKLQRRKHTIIIEILRCQTLKGSSLHHQNHPHLPHQQLPNRQYIYSEPSWLSWDRPEVWWRRSWKLQGWREDRQQGWPRTEAQTWQLKKLELKEGESDLSEWDTNHSEKLSSMSNIPFQ